MSNIQLLGRLFITSNIEILTGLHIGNSGGALEIGGSDNPILRHTITKEPYIPGSSLRGKMRSLLEKKLGKHLESLGNVRIHVCTANELDDPCPVCKIFGVSAQTKGFPTRLIVRDVSMTESSKNALNDANTNELFTEIKWENAIDRINAAANPRNIERVPSGTVFGPAEMVFSLYEETDIELLRTLLDCMQLIEDDYLGGGGSRGNGKIRFANIKVTGRNGSDYSSLQLLNSENYENCYPGLPEFVHDFENLKVQIHNKILKG